MKQKSGRVAKENMGNWPLMIVRFSNTLRYLYNNGKWIWRQRLDSKIRNSDYFNDFYNYLAFVISTVINVTSDIYVGAEHIILLNSN